MPERPLTLGDLKRGPRAPVTVEEWDVTPGLHVWIAGEIQQLEEKAKPLVGVGTCPSWGHCQEDCFHPDGVGTNGAGLVLRRCAADRKILAAHPYIVIPHERRARPRPTFACETCHVDDGYVSGGGNCATVLALAEGFGLDDENDADVEVTLIPKKKRTPAQKLAREIQASTGKAYTARLTEAQQQLAAEGRTGGPQ